ncbi:hypothetical protein Q1695_009601 [Nippostrongylus brasiliensis]|nr:hypothetical protein Q1695_009601 [Nippostrongylus brasiliensis]
MTALLVGWLETTRPRPPFCRSVIRPTTGKAIASAAARSHISQGSTTEIATRKNYRAKTTHIVQYSDSNLSKFQISLKLGLEVRSVEDQEQQR